MQVVNTMQKLDRLEGETAYRPKEGDLIYFPFDDGIFEIKYVMFDQPFFQLGKGYVFEIQCERFEYSGATFETGYENVDDTMKEPDYYRLEFDCNTETGIGTFDFQEKVHIIGLGEYDIIDGGSSLLNVFNIIGNLESGDQEEPALIAGNANDIKPDGLYQP